MLCCGSFQLSVSPLHVIRWLIRQWLMHGAAGCAVAAALRWRLRRLGVMPRREAKSNEEFIPLHWKRSFGHLILYVGHATLAWLVLPVFMVVRLVIVSAVARSSVCRCLLRLFELFIRRRVNQPRWPLGLLGDAFARQAISGTELGSRHLAEPLPDSIIMWLSHNMVK